MIAKSESVIEIIRHLLRHMLAKEKVSKANLILETFQGFSMIAILHYNYIKNPMR